MASGGPGSENGMNLFFVVMIVQVWRRFRPA